MEDATLTKIESEVRDEMQLSPSIPSDMVKTFIREGEYTLNETVEFLEIDFDTDLISRVLLKNYVRYAIFVYLNTFFKEYKGDLYATQIRYIQ